MEHVSNNGVEILIAEDSPTQAEQLKYLLEEQGHRVTVAANGKQALSLIRKRKPMLIITDIMMPEMDGYTFCKTIKSDPETKGIPVILLTTLTSPEDVIKGLESSADNFIRKPYDEKYLLSRVRYILTNRELRKTDNIQMGIEIFFGGKRHFITAERQQILDLLISTYEGAIHVNTELKAREKDLESANAEMKVKQADLETAQAKYRGLLESTGEGIYGIDLQGRCTFMNKAAAQMLGYRPDEVISKNMHGLLHHSHGNGSPYPVEECPIHNMFTTGRECRVNNEVFWRNDRSLFPVECMARPIGAGGTITGAVVSFSDITERKLLEQAIVDNTALMEQERNRYQALLDSSTDGLAMGDLERRLIFMNATFAEIFGIEQRQGYIGKPITHIRQKILQKLREADTYVNFMETAWAHPESSDQLILDLVDGATLRLRTGPVRDRSGRIIGRNITLTDQTKERAIDRMKSELVSTVSHELRTPLASILGFSELLMKRSLPAQKQTAFVDIIHKEAKRLTALINDFLDLQRIEAGKLGYDIQPMALPNLLRTVEGVCAGQSTRHRLIMRYPNDLPQVMADPEALQQVLQNLLSNAVKYSPEGGEIVLTVEARPEENLVQVSVRDHGLGIPEEAFPKLFEKFFRVDTSDHRKIGGTGLGLSLCREIIKALEGTITVASQLGHGSTFAFTIPMANEATGSRFPQAEKKPKKWTGGA